MFSASDSGTNTQGRMAAMWQVGTAVRLAEPQGVTGRGCLAAAGSPRRQLWWACGWQRDGHAAGRGYCEAVTWMELLSETLTRHWPCSELSDKSRADTTVLKIARPPTLANRHVMSVWKDLLQETRNLRQAFLSFFFFLFWTFYSSMETTTRNCTRSVYISTEMPEAITVSD